MRCISKLILNDILLFWKNASCKKHISFAIDLTQNHKFLSISNQIIDFFIYLSGKKLL
tara:strand:- start:1770 stop:1943 length:174 start_codon:yes stop_codon:yes gene_type:complete